MPSPATITVINEHITNVSIVDNGNTSTVVVTSSPDIVATVTENTVKPHIVITTAQQGPEGIQGPEGVGLEYQWSGTQLGVKREVEPSFNFVDLRGAPLQYEDLTPEEVEEFANSVVPADANYTNVFLNALLA